jgi:hypothetical protein
LKSMSYFVEYFPKQHNSWIRYSRHRNQEYADANFDVKVEEKKSCRIIHHGKIVKEWREE